MEIYQLYLIMVDNQWVDLDNPYKKNVKVNFILSPNK